MIGPYELDVELKRKPFVPFRIVTTAGKTYDITERDVRNTGAGMSYVFIGIRTQDRDDIFDRHEKVVYEKIARLEPLAMTRSMGC